MSIAATGPPAHREPGAPNQWVRSTVHPRDHVPRVGACQLLATVAYVSRVILMCGPAGSGKSRTARDLERAGFARLSFDELAWRRGHHSHPLSAPVAEEIHGHLRELLAEFVRAGVDVVVDSSFWSRESRDNYRDFLAPFGVTPTTYYMATPREIALRRVASREHPGPDSIILTSATAQTYFDHFEVPSADEGPLRIVDGRDVSDG